MMIAVRLRAIQLEAQDPQPWAVNAMYAATLAVTFQVGCSLCPVYVASSAGGSDEEDQERALASPLASPDGATAATAGSLDGHIAGKVATIAALAFRYVASAVLYVAVAVLIAALLTMRPVVPAAAV